MDVVKLLDYLQEIIESAAKIPMTGKVVINKNESMEVIDKIISVLPDELKKAQWVCQEKERILSEAIAESETIKKENILMLKREIENHDITKEAKNRAEQIIASSQKDAKEMRLGARDYANEILNQLEKELNSKGNEMIENLKLNLEDYVVSMQKQIAFNSDTIKQNIKELRNIK